jgi:hypothetical protein
VGSRHDGLGDAPGRRALVVNGTPASSLSFPATTLNGTNQTVTASLAFDVSDATGSGAG